MDRLVAVVCVFKSGGEYDPYRTEYITRLRDGIKRHTKHAKYEFICLTDVDLNLEGVKEIKLIHDLPGWHSKFELFRKDLFSDYSQVVYFDIDTSIEGCVDVPLLANYDFAMLEDFYHKGRFASGVMSFNPKQDWSFILEKALVMRPSPRIGDQELIAAWVEDAGTKIFCLQDFHDITSYKRDARDASNPKFGAIVCFHGHPRPHEIKWNLREGLIRNPTGIQHAIRHWKVPETIYEGQDVYIIGGGPSLKEVHLDEWLQDRNVFAINDGYLMSCADQMFFGDEIWWKHHRNALKLWGKPIFTNTSVSDDCVYNVRQVGGGLPKRPGIIGWNGNSGFAGLSLCLHFKPKRIFLLGFDMKFGKDGESNWHDNIRKVACNTYQAFLAREAAIKRDYLQYWQNQTDVWNANPDSAMTAFPKCELMPLLERNEVVPCL